jgi:two-component system sensor histidine kinase AlgZ
MGLRTGMKSRNHNNRQVELPNFCHLGVNLRIALTVEAALIAGVVARASGVQAFWTEFIALSALAQPALLLTLLALCAAGRWLRSQAYQLGVGLTLAIGVAVPVWVAMWLSPLLDDRGALPPTGVAAFSLLIGAGLLSYFNLRARALSPAITEARLQALQARIRPHFLFNSLNAVLALVRSDPRRAERTLEDLADLFRALMSDNRNLVRLADEIALIERYAAIEQLRLGDRLRMSWDLDQAPVDALLPPLILQPLLENAVYHGVEPATGIGDVLVRIAHSGDRVRIHIENPWHAAGGAGKASVRAGNHMALDNIRERLMLFFDAEAALHTRIDGGRYCVDIEIPYRSRT